MVVLGEERVERAQVPSAGGKDHNWAAARETSMHCVGLSAMAKGSRLVELSEVQ